MSHQFFVNCFALNWTVSFTFDSICFNFCHIEGSRVWLNRTITYNFLHPHHMNSDICLIGIHTKSPYFHIDDDGSSRRRHLFLNSFSINYLRSDFCRISDNFIIILSSLCYFRKITICEKCIA